MERKNANKKCLKTEKIIKIWRNKEQETKQQQKLKKLREYKKK